MSSSPPPQTVTTRAGTPQPAPDRPLTSCNQFHRACIGLGGDCDDNLQPDGPTNLTIVDEDDQAFAELIAATIELAILTFSYPLTVLTHLEERVARAPGE